MISLVFWGEVMKEKIKSAYQFLISTTNGMAYGLFATLIIGTIIGTIGTLFSYGNNNFCKFIYQILGNGTSDGVAKCLQLLTGAGIGVGIAFALKFDSLKTIVMAASGEIAAYLSLTTKFVTNQTISNGFKIGDPLTIYFVCILVAILIKLVLKKKTAIDILLVPLFGVIVATILAMLLRYPVIYITYGIQWLIGNATQAQPFIMGVVVAVLMGMALTAPISSAAIAAMIFVGEECTHGSGLAIASGAAIVGCCTQMVGFAIQSRKDNNIGMVLSIGVGTSMLQFKNILKKPIIWLPTIIASAILGPIATIVLKTECFGSSAGMGTAGLVGQIGTLSTMGINNWQTWVSIFVLEILAPLILVFFIDLLFRKFNLIKDGDLKV